MFFKFSNFKKKKSNRAFSIVEMIIGVAVFAIIAISIYSAFAKVVDLVSTTKLKVTAINLISEQFELIRNLSYDDVGLKNGLPAGVLDHTREITRNGVNYLVTTTIRSIDDPYDGLIGGTPNDSSPADYKMVEVEVNCPYCKTFTPVVMNSIVAPKNLETTSANGALFVQVFNASGQPISGVDTSIRNDDFVPAIVINDTTNQNGFLQLVDVPPAIQSYEISVSKPGYSSDQTYAPGDVSNPNPLKPHSTVTAGQITQISFAIDALSSINFSSVTETCAAVPNVDFNLKGTKLIGENPDILKFDNNFSTDNFGVLNLGDLEWDSYSLSILGTTYDLLGVNPEFPLNLLPGEVKNVQMVLAPKNPTSLIVNVKDGATSLPLSGVLVTLTNDGGFNNSQTTGQGFVSQNDWSGGGGQEVFTDETKYFESNHIDNSGGDLKLALNDSEFFSNGSLVSSTFDLGSPSNFYKIAWQPENQPTETGTDSAKFQLATNNDGQTWNFIGPDGTDSSFYTLTNSNLHSSHNGNQFFRYKIFLNTASTTFTPTASEISVVFASDCVSPGQTRFSGLSAGDYHILLEKTGYQPVQTDITISGNSAYQEFNLIES